MDLQQGVGAVRVGEVLADGETGELLEYPNGFRGDIAQDLDDCLLCSDRLDDQSKEQGGPFSVIERESQAIADLRREHVRIRLAIRRATRVTAERISVSPWLSGWSGATRSLRRRWSTCGSWPAPWRLPAIRPSSRSPRPGPAPRRPRPT
jgi:hypothetical protein